MKQKSPIYLYISYSVIASLFIFLLVFFLPPNPYGFSFFDKLVIVVIFCTSCILGSSFAIFPRWFKKKFFPTHVETQKQQKHKSIAFKGHHPDCSTFSTHILFIKKKHYCAGCFGLTIGALVSIILSILYLISNWSIPFTKLGLVIGVLIIFLLYAEIFLLKRNTVLHIFMNIFLIIDFFYITISVIELTKNTAYGILTIFLCFLWVDTRIQLSNWQHKKICRTCDKLCKMY